MTVGTSMRWAAHNTGALAYPPKPTTASAPKSRIVRRARRNERSTLNGTARLCQSRRRCSPAIGRPTIR